MGGVDLGPTFTVTLAQASQAPTTAAASVTPAVTLTPTQSASQAIMTTHPNPAVTTSPSGGASTSATVPILGTGVSAGLPSRSLPAVFSIIGGLVIGLYFV